MKDTPSRVRRVPPRRTREGSQSRLHLGGARRGQGSIWAGRSGARRDVEGAMEAGGGQGAGRGAGQGQGETSTSVPGGEGASEGRET